ncbi:MAG: DUF3443 domain-containing protein [Syntrophaceae bacterium]
MKGFSLRNALVFIVFVLWLFPLGCGSGGGGSSNKSQNQTNVPSGQNVQQIVVNGGPTASIPPAYGGYIYPNAAFTSVTICNPGTSICQTIDGVLVDTGSYGLRLLASAIKISLPTQTTNSSYIGECVQFMDGSYIWGPVKKADIKMAGEMASTVPIQVIDHNFYAVPSDCTAGGGIEEDDLLSLGANGILGIGPYQHDCPACVPGGGTPPSGAYYECSAVSGCNPAFVSLSQQVQNPVALFSTNNNGVIISFPAVSGPTASINGYMIFGIGTQSNNGLGNAKVLTLNQYESIETTYKSKVMPYSFIDSGSNGIYFPDISISQCSGGSGLYCPANTLNLTATNRGYNGINSTVNFSVGNALQMYIANPDDAVFNTFAGYTLDLFDWGLPFFYGRNVYTAIEGAYTPAGPGPYWAY